MVIGGKLYPAGGANSAGAALAVTESFSMSKNKWVKLASMPQPVDAAGAAVSKGLLYCFGGGSSNVQFQGSVFSNVQIYQP